MEEEIPVFPKLKHTGRLIAGAVLLILLVIILRHNLAFQKKSTVVLPAGGTYLGPTPTPLAQPTTNYPPPTPQPTTRNPQPTPPADKDGSYTTSAGKFAVTADAPRVTVRGNIYPYFFRSPSALKLVTLPGDNKYDIWAMSWNNTPPDQNVLIGVDNLEQSKTMNQYISSSKRPYVENWWKQFGGLKGVATISEFTNSQGLRGYRARYLDSANKSPNEDIFFEVSDPKFVIHMAAGILDDSVFNTIIDSVGWSGTAQ
jgi:hypothetical protein